MALAPVGRRAARVVALQGLSVVCALVAEARAERVLEARLGAQALEQEVRDLVAEVADHGPVGLAHLLAPTHDLGRVRLAHVDGHEPRGMTHGHRRLAALHRLRQKVEARPLAPVPRPEPAPAREPRENPALGGLGLGPERAVLLLKGLGDHLRHRAGAAKRAVLSLGRPVAGDLGAVGARVIGGNEARGLGVEGDGGAAGAGEVVEEQRRVAGGTGEDAHGWVLSAPERLLGSRGHRAPVTRRPPTVARTRPPARPGRSRCPRGAPCAVRGRPASHPGVPSPRAPGRADGPGPNGRPAPPRLVVGGRDGPATARPLRVRAEGRARRLMHSVL